MLLAVACCAHLHGAGGQEPQGTIERVSASEGSALGGQRLSIHGVGFTTNFHKGRNSVRIGTDEAGWTDCTVVEGACTVDCGSATRLVCDTQSARLGAPDASNIQRGASSQWLDLVINSSALPSGSQSLVKKRAFRFTSPRNSARNPTLLGVQPLAVGTGEALSMMGSRFGSNIKEYGTVYIGRGAVLPHYTAPHIRVRRVHVHHSRARADILS